jgi:hypothetical protein
MEEANQLGHTGAVTEAVATEKGWKKPQAIQWLPQQKFWTEPLMS